MSALKEKFFSVVSCYGQQLGLKTVNVLCDIFQIFVFLFFEISDRAIKNIPIDSTLFFLPVLKQIVHSTAPSSLVFAFASLPYNPTIR